MRQLEIDKYRRAYTNHEYRMGRARHADVIRIVSSLPKGTLLDVGTGRGETLGIAREYGHISRGTEVVDYLLREDVVYAEAHALPFPDASFDHVTCFDVLEHLTEEDLVPALSEFYRVARKSVIVSASWKSHVYQGVELHVSHKPAHDWEALIKSVWGACFRNGNAGKISGCWQVLKCPS